MKGTLETLRKEKLDLEAAKKRLGEMLEGHVRDDEDRQGYLDKLVIKNGELGFKFNVDALIKFLDTMDKIEGDLN